MTGRSYGGVSAAERVSTRRASLLESCRTVIGREGVAAATVEAVCAESALGKRYFYESFATRDEMLLAVADAFYDDLLAQMHAAIVGLPDGDRPRPVVETLVAALGGDQRLARLYVESPATPVLAERRHRAIDDYTRFVADEVLPAPAADEQSRTRQRLATRLLVAGTTDLVAGWLAGEVSGDADDIVEAIAAVGAGLAGS